MVHEAQRPSSECSGCTSSVDSAPRKPLATVHGIATSASSTTPRTRRRSKRRSVPRRCSANAMASPSKAFTIHHARLTIVRWSMAQLKSRFAGNVANATYGQSRSGATRRAATSTPFGGQNVANAPGDDNPQPANAAAR